MKKPRVKHNASLIPAGHWYPGKPPGIGWWPARPLFPFYVSQNPNSLVSANVLRFWNGAEWSIGCAITEKAKTAGYCGSVTTSLDSLYWTHKWWE